MTLSAHALAALAVDMQNGLPGRDRFNRMIASIHHLLRCDATALLRYEDRQFRPLATAGLAPDVMGRRFSLAAHPRLEPSPAPAMWCVSPPTATCRTLTTG